MTLTISEPSDLDSYTLTPAGWPRPIIDGYPIPWVAPAERLSEVNEGRRLASVGGSICQVCGGDFVCGELAYGFTDRIEEGYPVMLLDGAMLHYKCAKLTAIRCPHVRDRSDLFCVEVPANDAVPMEDAEGKLRPTYSSEDCTIVAWPDPRRS